MDIISIHLTKYDLALGAASIFIIGVCSGILLIYGLSSLQDHLETKRMQRLNFDRRMFP